MRTGYRWLWLDLAALTVLAALIGLPSINSIGLATWQESQRAMVAREMWVAGEWIVPQINGQPYLAKPPLFYWCQFALTPVLGAPPSELELRVTTALWGLFGVLATYWVARALAREGFFASEPDSETIESRARLTGLLAAIMLLTGPAYAYAARVGEIDITLPASVTLAVGGIALAWMRWLRTGRTSWSAVALAAMGSIIAALAKGPPPLGVIAAAGLGGIALHAAFAVRVRGVPLREPSALTLRVATVIGLLGTLPFTIPDFEGPQSVIGAVVLMLLGAGLAVVLVRLSQPTRLAALLRGVWSTQPIITLGLGAAAFGAWVWAAVRQVGVDTAVRWSEGEVQSNVRFLNAEVPYGTFANALWSVGLGSVLAIVTFIWIIGRRPRIQPAGFLLVAWVIIGLAIFSCFGKGFPRYLLPLWPGVAMLGAAGAVVFIIQGPHRVRARTGVLAVLAVLIVVESVWFGVIRPHVDADRSPRAMIDELIAAHGVKAEDLTVFQFWTAAVDYYAQARPMIVGDVLENDQNVGSKPLTEAEFSVLMRASGQTRVVLVRESDRPDRLRRGRGVPGPQRLRNLGLTLEPIATKATYRFDGGRSPILAFRVRAGGPGAASTEPPVGKGTP